MADEKLEFEGTVTAAHGNGLFTVLIDGLKEPTEIPCRLSGKIRQNNIRIMEGDRVKLDVSVYDLKKGRITFRIKN